ncbi:unnamed protein product [Rotaria magnacalcarata]|uniref:Uncharacterized protein n=1 Tax=Rotaria magnacalcarata TaxID=392030 RepID=A0A8S2QX10_9BILA|nr:unnamed protein product [Rotaria magnacalcarata]
MSSASQRNGKNSLTFESVVCSQLELQRRAASFSHRRNTMCRRSSQCPLSSSSSSSNRFSVSLNRIILLSPISSPLSTPYPSARTSTSDGSAMQFMKTRNSCAGKRRRTSSAHSIIGNRMESIIDRQSLGSIFYWDATSRNAAGKKNDSRWSIDFPKETPFYWSLRSRLIEEYTESESLLEFAKKTVLVLMKTSNFHS